MKSEQINEQTRGQAGWIAETNEARGFRPVQASAPRGRSKTLGAFGPLPELQILGSCTLQSQSFLKELKVARAIFFLCHFHISQEETSMGESSPVVEGAKHGAASPLFIYCPQKPGSVWLPSAPSSR